MWISVTQTLRKIKLSLGLDTTIENANIHTFRDTASVNCQSTTHFSHKEKVYAAESAGW